MRGNNLLHLRKRALEKPKRDFIDAHGREPVGHERSAIVADLQKAGASQRTIQLATKGDRRRRYADEVLALRAVFDPILSGRDCFVLTADGDVLDQWYQLTVLIHDDYGSFLLAEDFRRRPELYPHAHGLSTPFLKPGARAFGRELEPRRLLPSVVKTCATWVINVLDGTFINWVATTDVERALAFQNRDAEGRVADAGSGLGLHISLGDKTCSASPAHFAVGADEVALAVDSEVGSIIISRFDVARAMQDKALPRHEVGRILMAGVPG